MQLVSDEDEDNDEHEDKLLDGVYSDLPSSSAADSDDSDESGVLLCSHSCCVQIIGCS